MRRDLSQFGQENGEVLVPVLEKLVNSKIINLDLLTPNQQRKSVIESTSRPSSTSTPTGSPSRANSVIQFLGPQIPTSPVSSISRLSDDVFQNIEDSSLPLYARAPGSVTASIIVTVAMEDIKKKLLLDERKLRQKIKNFNLDRVTKDLVVTNKYLEKLDEIESFKDDLVFGIEDFLIDYTGQLSAEDESGWKSKIDSWQSTVNKHCIDVQNKAADIREMSSSSNLLTQATVPRPTSIINVAPGLSSNISTIETVAKKDAAKNKAKSKWDVICSKCNTLNDKTRAYPDWSLESDLVISRGMKEIKSWEEDMEKITALYQELTEHLIDWDIQEIDCGIFGAKDIVSGVEKAVSETVGLIKSEDDSRALYTLDSNKHELVKYPTFQGLDNEDFNLFKTKVEKAFETNRVIMSDRVTKLRSCLRGNALSLVPESSVKSISDAWTALEAAYGAPERLMRSKKEAISKLGLIPKENSGKGQPNFKNQITWFLQLESLISEIIVLGSKSVELGREAFSPSHINFIIGLFRGANSKMLQLAQCTGSGVTQLNEILTKIASMRSDAQKLLNITQDAIGQSTADF